MPVTCSESGGLEQTVLDPFRSEHIKSTKKYLNLMAAKIPKIDIFPLPPSLPLSNKWQYFPLFQNIIKRYLKPLTVSRGTPKLTCQKSFAYSWAMVWSDLHSFVRRSALFEENIKPNFDSSHFSFLFLVKDYRKQGYINILVLIRFCLNMVPYKTVYSTK